MDKTVWTKRMYEVYNRRVALEKEGEIMNPCLETKYETMVVYQSKYYTIVNASTILQTDKGEKKVCAEGVARRSWKDSDNPTMGKQIAEGRALKALAMKIHGRRVRHALMNG